MSVHVRTSKYSTVKSKKKTTLTLTLSRSIFEASKHLTDSVPPLPPLWDEVPWRRRRCWRERRQPADHAAAGRAVPDAQRAAARAARGLQRRHRARAAPRRHDACRGARARRARAARWRTTKSGAGSSRRRTTPTPANSSAAAERPCAPLRRMSSRRSRSRGLCSRPRRKIGGDPGLHARRRRARCPS